MCESKLYELRHYQVAARDVAAYRSQCCKIQPWRVQQSHILGYWIVDIGDVNHVFHIWEYDSLEHRKEVRDALMQSEGWLEYVQEVSPMLQHMENWICKPLHGDFGTLWSDKEFYKLTTVRFLQSDSQSSAREKFLAAVQGSERVKAVLETVIGNGREFTLLESSDSLDSFLAGPGPFDDEPTVSVQTRIMYCFPWNQWVAGK